jgi:glycerol-3-phosphate acyltransferase PlsY
MLPSNLRFSIISLHTMKKWQRNVYHLGTGLLFPIGYYFGHKIGTVITIAIFFLILLALEIARFKHPGFNKWAFKHLNPLFKPKEKSHLVGTTYFLLGALITVIFSPKYIAIVSLTFLAVADVAAAFVGERYGRIKFFDKTLEGSMAFFITSIVIGIVLMQLPKMQTAGLNFQLVIWGALTATIVELFSVKIDDNLTIPILTSLIMILIS